MMCESQFGKGRLFSKIGHAEFLHRHQRTGSAADPALKLNRALYRAGTLVLGQPVTLAGYTNSCTRDQIQDSAGARGRASEFEALPDFWLNEAAVPAEKEQDK